MKKESDKELYSDEDRGNLALMLLQYGKCIKLNIFLWGVYGNLNAAPPHKSSLSYGQLHSFSL